MTASSDRECSGVRAALVSAGSRDHDRLLTPTSHGALGGRAGSRRVSFSIPAGGGVGWVWGAGKERAPAGGKGSGPETRKVSCPGGARAGNRNAGRSAP